MRNAVVVVAACVATLSVVTQGFGSPAPPPSNRQTLHRIQVETGHEVSLLQQVYDQVRELHGRLDGLPGAVRNLQTTATGDHLRLAAVQGETQALYNDLETGRSPSIGQQITDLHERWFGDIVNAKHRFAELDCIYEQVVLGNASTCKSG
jgi:hypothetical protein